MLIFLYGEDTYKSKQKLQEIVQHYKEVHKSGLNLKFFDGLKLAYQDFKEEFQQSPMFKEKKLFILKEVVQNSAFAEAFLDNSAKFSNSQDIILFFEGGAIVKNKLSAFLIKNAKTQEFQPLAGLKLKNWIQKKFDQHKTKIEPQVIEILIQYIGNDLWRMSQEIEKLSTFKNQNEVTAADIRLLVRPNIENDIFKTIDALAQRNKKQAISLLHDHLDKGDSPLYLLSMINFQFRNLLMVKTSQNFKMHPYVIRKSSLQARMFSADELKKIYSKLFEVDRKIKTGKIEPQAALDLLVTEI